MITDYKKTKNDVLSIYNDKFSSLVIEGIKQGRETTFDSELKTLAEQAEVIKQDKFKLMIAGEAKSGKSTFINAYLGTDILPMDVKQCTSAIVEIRYGAKFILKATYADDKVEIIESEERIREFLSTNAAIDDDYRSIPVPTININILMNYKGRNVPEPIIKDLMKGIANENIHNLSSAEYEAKVREYIKVKTPVWNTIVKKIEIEYPFEDEDMKNIQIVDSPGVNAEGRVGEITDEYIANANAVMFLKPITGQAVEATAFKNFLGGVSAGRNKNAMFLILTRAANETPDNIVRIREEALRQFPTINQEQVICVDSKVELFYNQIKNMSAEELEQYMDTLIETNKLDAFLETPWYRAKFKKDVYMTKLKELSNFNVIDSALNQFAHKAQYLLLSEFLGRMLDTLKKVNAILVEDKENYEKKAVDPKKFELEIIEVQTQLNNLTLAINHKVSEIGDKYTFPNGEIDKRAKEVMEDYEAEIAKINPDSSKSVDELEKISYEKIDIYKRFQEDLLKRIVAECDDALIELSDKTVIKFPETIKPDVTKNAIETERAKIEKEERAKKEYYTTGKTFKETHERSAFSQSRYFGAVKKHIDGKIETIRKDAVKDLKRFATDTVTTYSEELSKNARIKRENLEILKERKESAEEIKRNIEVLAGQLESVDKLAASIEALKGGIDKNVN